MKKLFVPLVCFGFLALSSCGKVSNEFVIRDPEKAVSSAEIRLCDERSRLTKSENAFRGKMPISCEGEGDIIVHFLDGHDTMCRIGYVTPGAEQVFEFVIKHGQCGVAKPPPISG